MLNLSLKLAAAGNLRKIAPQLETAWRDACATVFKLRVTALKEAVRREVVASGLGPRVANTVRSRLFKTSAGELGGVVFSSWLVKRKGGRVDLLTAFQGDISITGNGKFLAIALTDKKKGADHRSRATPEDFPEGTFELVPLHRRGNYLLVDKATGDAVFLLTPRVRIGKRLSNFAAAVARAERGLQEACLKETERRLEKIFKAAA